MNQLNSVLFEGTVTDIRECTKRQKKTVVYTLRNTRGEKKLLMDAYVTGELAEKARHEIKEGMDVRVLGRLVRADGKIAIYGQHLEFRRKKNKSNDTKDVSISE